MEIEVVDIQKVSDGRLKAWASVKFAGVLIIRGFSVIDGRNGFFVLSPVKLAKDGHRVDVVVTDELLKEKIEEAVIDAYELEGGDNEK